MGVILTTETRRDDPASAVLVGFLMKFFRAKKNHTQVQEN